MFGVGSKGRGIKKSQSLYFLQTYCLVKGSPVPFFLSFFLSFFLYFRRAREWRSIGREKYNREQDRWNVWRGSWLRTYRILGSIKGKKKRKKKSTKIDPPTEDFNNRKKVSILGSRIEKFLFFFLTLNIGTREQMSLRKFPRGGSSAILSEYRTVSRYVDSDKRFLSTIPSMSMVWSRL